MAISMDQVKELRERTGAGILECKKVLEQSDGDINRALELLREKGLEVAKKKATREVREGRIEVYVHHDAKKAALVELNCETDFVARTDDFQELAHQIAEYAEEHPNASVEEITSDAAIQNSINEKVAKLGERIVVKQVRVFEGGPNTALASYIHTGGKIGVMVEGEIPEDASREEAQSLFRDMAMHISFAKPEYLTRGEVPEDVVAREREIHSSWAKNEGKPEAAIPKIVDGRMEKYYEQVVLHEQPFVKDQDRKIQQVLNEHSSKGTLKRFIRLRVGEE